MGALGALAALGAISASPRNAAAHADRDSWWCYQPLVRPDVPAVERDDCVSNPIDAFILSKLEDRGLSPAPRAARGELIRRATYDLTGLPPTPEEVDAFVNDASPDAWERLIERLLASPHYGEKWGRHWLDLVRYAESDSYERDRTKPHVWKYRDYVIESFNRDTPYDQFIIEQLAGDEIEQPTVRSIIATGYYRLGIWDDEPTDPLQAQYDDLDSILSTTSQVMLGMTVNCARCHDHKKDPIPQADYYRMLAYFENIRPYREVNRGNQPTYENVVRQVAVDMTGDVFAHALEDYRLRREQLLRAIEATKERAAAARNASSDAGTRGRSPLPPGEGVGVRASSLDTLLPAVHLSFDDPSFSEALRVETAGAPKSIEGRRGRGRALAFDGRNDSITIPRPVQDDFTIGFFFRTNSTGRGGNDYRWFLGEGLVDGEVPGIVRDFGVSYHSDGRITAGTGEPETFIHSPPGLNDGGWHHVAFTRERSTGRIALFIDGEEVAAATGSTESLDASQTLTIGRMNPGRGHFEGAIDEVMLFDRSLDQREVLALAHGGAFDPSFTDLVRNTLGEEERRRHEENVAAILALKRPVEEKTDVLCVTERGREAGESFIRIRGNAASKGELVQPGIPSALGLPDPAPAPPTAHGDAGTSGRRLTFARWLASADNPLTARVMANRIWQHHFGRGIVPSSNDFGRLGELPTHPELLDWLATEFMARGWSIKSMHRLIMMSSAYRMSSRGNAEGLAADPQNTLFWRFDMRRLGAEEVRDSILAVNGTLNLKMGGPSVYPPMPAEVLATSSRPGEAWGTSSAEDAVRRSIYIHAKRSLLTPFLLTFDLADTDNSCPVRFATTQPTQALTMLNSDFMQEQAAALAARLKREAGDDRAAQARLAWRLTTSREATREEVAESLDLMESLEAEEGSDSETSLKHFCLVMLNLNEFVYLD
jgi:hypothetical protein